MSPENKILILLTSSYPFGKEEPLLNTEINYLSAAFDKIIIFSIHPEKSKPQEIPSNVTAYLLDSNPSSVQKVGGLRFIFTGEFWTEYKVISSTYGLKFNFKILKVMLNSYLKGYHFYNFLKKFSLKNDITIDNLYFYSWWCRDKNVGIALLKKKYPKLKAFTRMHGYDLYFERHDPAYLPYRSLIFKKFDNIFFISEQGKNYIKEKFATTFPNHLVSKLGVSNNRPFQSKPKTAKISLVSCSNLIPLKRVHLIIEALAIVSANVEVNWTHFGTGPLLPTLKKLAQEKLSNKANIQYSFAGFIDNQEILNYFETHPTDLFINVSETEGIPISIMEAYSFGIPSIATDVGGVSEIVNDKNGYLLSKNLTCEDITKSIMHYLNLSEEEQKQKQIAAYQKWKTEHRAETNFSQLCSLILNK